MSRLTSSRAVLAALVGVALLGACDSDRATVLEPFGEPTFNFRTLPATAASQALPGGSISVARPATGTGTITVTLRNLEPLAGSAVYKVWLVDSAGTTFVPATGEVLLITTGATTDTTTAPPASTTSGFAANQRVVLRITAETLGSDPTANRFGAVVVTIEDNASATTAGPVRPLFARYALAASGASTQNVNLSFGNFNADTSQQYVFSATGRGTAGVRANALFIDDSSLARPPRGYYYAAYAVAVAYDADADEFNVVDTLPLGDLNAPYPREGVSLRDADERLVDPVVTDRPMAIDAASLRFFRSTGNFLGFRDLFVVLKAKRAADETLLPANRVLVGTLPEQYFVPEDEGTE